MASPRVVLLNDTDVDGYHFGCARVMSTIRNQLRVRGIEEAGAVRVSLNWRDAHEALVNSADLLVINGEGTLHHGSRKGRWLLEAAQSVCARGGKVALINALWQDNPADWTDLIKDVDILACRDSRSVAAFARECGRTPRFLGDLSMTQPVPDRHAPRFGTLVGDSVHGHITSGLAAQAAALANADLVPVTSGLKFISPNLKGLRRAARVAYAKVKQDRYLARNPKARFVTDEAAYIDLIQTKALSVTGRFHAACLAVATRTPFVAVQSNSWKIEALLEDVGLSSARMMPIEALTAAQLSPDAWAFSETEHANIEKSLADWHAKADQLFDDIAALI